MQAGGSCDHEDSALQFCAEAHTEHCVQDLIRVASARCKQQVASFQNCRAKKSEQDCEALDLATMECAARHVMSNARRAPASR